MKLIFLGTGSAFALDGNFQSNILLQSENGKNLLLDCGTDIRFALAEQGLYYYDISDVYISHMHADHVGGLEWLAFTTKFDPRCPKVNLFAHDDIAKNLWDKTLSGGLSSIQGLKAEISTYFEVFPVEENDFFMWQHIKFQIVQTIHFLSGFAIMPSYGLFFNVNGCQIFITTDTQFTPVYFEPMYRAADLIFHDCETSPAKSGVHAHYSDLVQLDPEIKRKMWLYHYNKKPLPKARHDGFAGFVKKGQIFNL